MTTSLNLNVANWISIVVAILFAYVTNSRFVFQSKAVGLKARLYEFFKFIGARAFTMVIEVVGVYCMTSMIHMNDFLSKFLIQFIVLVLNYIFSKFLVFKRHAF
jgi:putative flippase GtrA